MKTVELLSEKPRKKWTAIFVLTIICISITCLSIMNIHYDELARYPYKDERSRTLIKEYLNKEEIDYIIEYSIAPNVFISFIKADDFNIYHSIEYKKLSEVMWMETPEHIVEMVEKTRDYMDVDTLGKYLEHYSFDDIEAYLTKSDIYSEDSELIEYANFSDVYLDDSHTVSTRIPNNLQELNELVPSDYTILVNERVQEPLMNLCSSINSDIENSNGCGGLVVTSGYISYDTQKILYEEAKVELGEKVTRVLGKPGHDEHQLGLAIDFAINGLLDEDFYLSEQYEWLYHHAWEFGFVQTYDETNIDHEVESYHYRYVGIDVAKEIHDKGLNFKEYNENKK